MEEESDALKGLWVKGFLSRNLKNILLLHALKPIVKM